MASTALKALCVAVLPVVLLCSCEERPAAKSAETTRSDSGPAHASMEAGGSKLNVLLISVDSLRADHLGAYGYERDTSPAMDRFAKDAVLFERAYTQAPWTLPAHASLLTSRYPRSHRVELAKARLPSDVPTLARVLAEQGYDTAAIVSGPFMKRLFGLDQGFAHYDDTLAMLKHAASHSAVTSPQITQQALDLLEGLSPPFFVMLHYWDVHYDYIPPEPYDRLFDPEYSGSADGRNFEKSPEVSRGMDARDLEHIVALYDGEIRYLDGYLGRLFEQLAKRGLMESTLIVLTADHGDEFFEHGAKGHAHSAYEELVHVPLIVRAPGIPGGARVAQPVRHIDVFPTVLDLLGIRRAGLGLQGRSLAPLLRGEPMADAPAFVETTRFRREKRRGVPFGTAEAVISGRHKLIRNSRDGGRGQLYDLEADRGEQRPLGDEERAEHLERVLAEWRASVPRGDQTLHDGLDSGTQRQLESLGYIEEE